MDQFGFHRLILMYSYFDCHSICYHCLNFELTLKHLYQIWYLPIEIQSMVKCLESIDKIMKLN